jgi:MarR family 2-MHQ and catechol resistance regulon transcriptional repressor
MGSRHKGPAGEVRALNAFIALQRAADSVETATQDEIARAGLTQSQFGALEALHHLGPLCAKDLSAKLLRTKGNLSLVLDNLEKAGLIGREAREEDRRIRTVALTAKGRRLIAGTFPRHARLVEKSMGALTAPEQEELRRLCRKLGRANAGADAPRRRS